MHSDFSLRKAREDDIPSIISLCKDTMEEAYGSIIPGEKLRPWIDGDLADIIVRAEWPSMVVAVVGDDVKGVVTVSKDEVGLLWVHPDHRRMGIGGALMDHAEQSITVNGFRIARLNCFSENERAIRFYRSRGYCTTRSEMNDEVGIMQDVMQKSIERLYPDDTHEKP